MKFLTTLLFAMFITVPALARDCSFLSDWLPLADQSWQPARARDRAARDRAEWIERNRVADVLFSDFLKGDFKRNKIEDCLQNHPLRANFLSALHRVFFEGTLARLERSDSPTLSRLVKELRKQESAGRRLIFRMISGAETADQGEAGYHRATRSLFLDIDRIPHQEWFLVFVHELVHALDEDIQSAMLIYSETWRVEKAGLPDSESREQFESWLRAGLDRGFWAEYRAWYYTIVIYQEGLHDGLWGKIHWVENILQSRESGVPLDRHIYDHFDKRFWDPRVGLFLRPEISEPLRELRERYRKAGSELPSRGSLRRLLEP